MCIRDSSCIIPYRCYSVQVRQMQILTLHAGWLWFVYRGYFGDEGPVGAHVRDPLSKPQCTIQVIGHSLWANRAPNATSPTGAIHTVCTEWLPYKCRCEALNRRQDFRELARAFAVDLSCSQGVYMCLRWMQVCDKPRNESFRYHKFIKLYTQHHLMLKNMVALEG